jgi:hypothetical protein
MIRRPDPRIRLCRLYANAINLSVDSPRRTRTMLRAGSSMAQNTAVA